MKIFFALAGLVLACCQASAGQLDLSRVKTSVDLVLYEPDTIVISTRERRLFYKKQDGAIIGYSVAVGRENMSWSGTVMVAQIKRWPDWTPPLEMLKRQPWLPASMAGGPGNPLGSRALYLFKDNRDTQYRIHGSSSPDSIGYAASSGCIRMFNKDVEELASLVRVGTKVVVLK